MYDSSRQYRCTIIRGKSQKEIDDLLPAYATILSDICPCHSSDFTSRFNDRLMQYLPADKRDLKTLNNHRTEIVGKLFGMYYIKADGVVYLSERTQKFLDDSDQPAFFKDMCFKMQFPNGTQALNTIMDRLKHQINLRPNAFVIKTLLYARNAGIVLTKNDIGYYILNALDVLQGKADPLEIIDAITKDRRDQIERRIHTPGKAHSWDMQHINEQINYLELANLVITDTQGQVQLNMNEQKAIDIFAESWNEAPSFDVYQYDLRDAMSKKQFFLDWSYYYSRLSSKIKQFETTHAALGIPSKPAAKNIQSSVEFGDEGEAYVFQFERERVKNFNARLANKVLSMGKVKGLGYDIQSVIAEPGPMSEFVYYIEVKSTRRVTEPDIEAKDWFDTINMTRNEWIAAQQHKDAYSVYRVYFVRNKVIMYEIRNIHQKFEDGHVDVVPTMYRVDFNKDAINKRIG